MRQLDGKPDIFPGECLLRRHHREYTRAYRIRLFNLFRLPIYRATMQFDYTMTVEDLREAYSPSPLARPHKATNPLFVFVPLLALCLTAACLGDGNIATVAGPERNLWLDVIPSIVAVHVLLLCKFGSITFPLLRKRAGFRRPSRLHLLWSIPLLYTPVIWLIPACFSQMSIVWKPDIFQVLGAAAVPWVSYGGILTYRRLRLQKKTLANLEAMKQRVFPACHFEVTDEFFSTDDGRVYCRRRWSAFRCYKETQNLLLLISTDGSIQMVGKRSVTDGNAINELRRLISDHIKEGEFLPPKAAFPVVPLVALILGKVFGAGNLDRRWVGICAGVLPQRKCHPVSCGQGVTFSLRNNTSRLQ